jgi:anti-anti-sigma regulatory factor
MEITIEQAEARVPVSIIRLKGKLNEAASLLTAAQQAYNAGARYFLIDLADVPYVSSAGLRALHEIFEMVRDQSMSSHEISQAIRKGLYTSQNLKLLKASRMVMDVLKMTGFDMFIEIYEDQKKALQSF